MKIAIDAGHGLYTAGKRCSKQYDPKETREWTLNDRVADKVISGLKDYNVAILRIDDPTGKKDISLNDRTKKANSEKCDVYISIHHNAGNGAGIETFCYSLNDKFTYGLAKAVNYNAVLFTGNKNRGVKSANFAVLRQTKMPAVLIECGFMDNAIDTPKILSESYSNNVANGIVKAIADFYNLQKKGGLTMGQYEELKKLITESKEYVYHSIEEVPTWGKPTMNKLISSGAFKGEEGDLKLSESMLRIFVVLDRQKIFG